MTSLLLALCAVLDRALTRQPVTTWVVAVWTIGVITAMVCGVSPW